MYEKIAGRITPIRRRRENWRAGHKYEKIACERCGKQKHMKAGFLYDKRKAASHIKSKYTFLCWDCKQESEKEVHDQKIASAKSQDLEAAIKKLKREGKTRAAEMLEEQLRQRISYPK